MEVLKQTLDGKQLEIVELKVVKKEQRLNMQMHFWCEGKFYSASFFNVSRINITNFSVPLQIGGLEIISTSEIGWDASSRYMFNDFEDTTLNFYFEDYYIM